MKYVSYFLPLFIAISLSAYSQKPKLILHNTGVGGILLDVSPNKRFAIVGNGFNWAVLDLRESRFVESFNQPNLEKALFLDTTTFITIRANRETDNYIIVWDLLKIRPNDTLAITDENSEAYHLSRLKYKPTEETYKFNSTDFSIRNATDKLISNLDNTPRAILGQKRDLLMTFENKELIFRDLSKSGSIHGKFSVGGRISIIDAAYLDNDTLKIVTSEKETININIDNYNKVVSQIDDGKLSQIFKAIQSDSEMGSEEKYSDDFRDFLDAEASTGYNYELPVKTLRKYERFRIWSSTTMLGVTTSVYGSVSQNDMIAFHRSKQFQLSISEDTIIISNNKVAGIAEVNKRPNVFYTIPGKSNLSLIDRERNIIFSYNYSEVFISNLATGELLLTLTMTSARNILIQHPSGLFDLDKEDANLYFVQGVDAVEFNQLKERYYEPGLWKKVVTGKELRSVKGLKSIDLPPQIEVSPMDKKGYLPIKLINRGGGIGKVSILINGKEVIEDARDKNVDAKSKEIRLSVYLSSHKNLIKGTENYITVKAWNSDHWVVSRGKVITYNSQESETHKPSVYILSSGVSDYTGAEIDLKYASKDAEDVSKAIQLGAKQLFGVENSYVYTLTTDRPKEFYPTKANILKALEKISSIAHPLDVFVMYVSGHGINYGGQDGDWHYLTQDAYTGNGSAYNDPAIRKQTTISSNELVELFKKVPALKQVLIIDACASGRVVENLMTQKDISSSTLRALDRMRDRTGMHIITGCTADAVSYEASKYGQGVLTYSLLEGIRGAALREDKFIDINRLFQYAHDRVPVLAEGIGGIQTPQVFSPQGAQSFDIGLLTEMEKKDIPIAKIRPVYIRSNFQDENELEDILGLGKIIDESLNEVSARGKDARLIFVDVKEYPDGCKLIGRYQKTDSKILLKLRKKCGEETTNYEIKADNVDRLKEEILKVL